MVERLNKKSNNKRMGAPKGNLNAIKHGFYSRFYKQVETDDITLIKEGLDDEIVMLRVLIRRAIELSDDTEDKEFPGILNAISLGVSRLGNTMHMNLVLSGKASDISQALMQALTELTGRNDAS
jgi:hypothetical protein